MGPTNNNILRIGFDVDGCLAHFSPGYQRVIAELTGKDLFLPGDAENPPCWDWDLLRGYTKEERARAFGHISRHPSFWYDCPPLQGVHDLQQSGLMNTPHEIYFITNRSGFRVKRQTESWLIRWLEGYNFEISPTVLVNSHRTKGLVAKALSLDAYIDDNGDNTMDVLLQAPKCKMAMLNASYNQSLPSAEEWLEKNKALFVGATEEEALAQTRLLLEQANQSRVDSVGEFLQAIGVLRATTAQ